MMRTLQDWLPDSAFLKDAGLLVAIIVTMITVTLVLTAATLAVLR